MEMGVHSDTRHYSRISHKKQVDISSKKLSGNFHALAINLSENGFFVKGAFGLKPDDRVEVQMHDPIEGLIDLNCRVVYVNASGCGLECVNCTPAMLLRLRNLAVPDWDGKHVLEGVLKLAPLHDATSLGDWLKLLSIMMHWKKH